MNNIFSRKETFWLLSLSALAVMGCGKAAVAQTKDTTSNFQLTQTNGIEASSVSVKTTQTSVRSDQSVVSPEQVSDNSATPVPGTTATSSAAIAPVDVSQPEAIIENPQQPTPVKSKHSHTKVAQADINPGRPTRGGSSYVGIGGNIGLAGGQSALGDGNFALISKIGVTKAFSVRPAAIIGDNTTILLPITYDLSFNQFGGDPFSESISIAPYIGAGAAINTGNGTEAAFLVTGGIDVPISRRFTATAAVNAAFFSDTSVGLLLGVGYNFRGL